MAPPAAEPDAAPLIFGQPAPQASRETQLAPQPTVVDRPAAAPTADAPPTPQAAQRPSPTHRISFSAREALVTKLERLRDLLGVQSLEEVIERAADRLLDEVAPERRARRRELRQARRQSKRNKAKAATSRPGAERQVPIARRSAPLAVRDFVFVRDGLCCQYRGPDGRLCGATRHLQVDHVRPFALGGSAEPDNQQILCAAHNRLRAIATFGAAVPRRRVP